MAGKNKGKKIAFTIRLVQSCYKIMIKVEGKQDAAGEIMAGGSRGKAQANSHKCALLRWIASIRDQISNVLQRTRGDRIQLLVFDAIRVGPIASISHGWLD